MFKRLNESLGETVTVTIDGQPTRVPAGETVAAAVLAHGTRFSRTTAISGAPRAPYCMMGVCFECMMVVDGRANVRACMERVRDGMRIEVQHGAGGQRE